MADAIRRAKPYTGEQIRRYETDVDRPPPDARRALARVFSKSEAFMEFGEAHERAHAAQQTSASYSGISDEALEIARAFDHLQPQAREFIREQVFIYTVIDKQFPWLRHGKPIGKSYDQFERWHQENIAASRDFENQRSGLKPREKEKEKRK